MQPSKLLLNRSHVLSLLPPVNHQQGGVLSPYQNNPMSPTPYCPVSEKLVNWLTQTLSLTNTLSLPDWQARIRGLISRRNHKGFTLGIMGETQRGKSTLINQLLECPLLPTGTESPAAIITISASPTPQATYSLDGQNWKTLAFPPLPLEFPEITNTPLAQIRLGIPSKLLQDNNITIVRYPSPEILLPTQLEQIHHSLATCDTVVQVINATYPFSLSESSLLEDWVFRQHIPYAIVAINRLHTIPVEEQNQVFDHLQARVAAVSEHTFLCTAGSHVDGSDEDSQTLRQIIVRGATEPVLTFQRSRQLASTVVECLEAILNTVRVLEAADQISHQKYDKRRKQNENEIGEAAVAWERIEIELKQRSVTARKLMREKLEEHKNTLINRLGFELSKTPDPKSWWENDLTYRLEYAELPFLRRQIEETMIPSLKKDGTWLQRQVKHFFAMDIDCVVHETSLPITDTGFDFASLPLADLEGYRLWARVGTAVAVIASYLLIPPARGIAMIASVMSSTTAVLVSEQMVKSTVTEQRQLLDTELRHTLDQQVNLIIENLSIVLQQEYEHLAKQLRSVREEWETLKHSEVKLPTPNQNHVSWRKAAEKASVLRQEILSSLK